MKKFIFARVLLLSVISSWANQSAASSAIDLFQINSGAFPLPVIYRASVNSNCTFASKPITVSWVGNTSKLPVKDKLFMGSYMGTSISSQSSQMVVFQVKAMANNKVSWPLTVQLSSQGGKCTAQAVSPDGGEVVQKINVLAMSGSLPTQVVIEGLIGGQAVQRDLNFQTLMASNQ